MGLVYRADEVRSSSKMHELMMLPTGAYTLLTACNATVNPLGTKVNPILACLLLVSGPSQHDALRGMGLVVPEHQESNQYAIALETGAEGKNRLRHVEAWPGNHGVDERCLTITSLLQSKGRIPKKTNFLAWMSHGLDGGSVSGAMA